MDGREEEVPLAALRDGDVVLLRPGARVPADGLVRAQAKSTYDKEKTTCIPFIASCSPPSSRRPRVLARWLGAGGQDDAIYAQGPLQREVPDIQVPRGPLPAGKDDTLYAGDYLPEQPLPGADATSAVGAPALCTCNSAGRNARSSDTGHHES